LRLHWKYIHQTKNIGPTLENTQLTNTGKTITKSGPCMLSRSTATMGQWGGFKTTLLYTFYIQIFDVVDFYLKRLRISPLAQHNCDVEEVGDFSARFRLSAGVDFFYWLRP